MKKHLSKWILLAACLLLVLAPSTASAAVKNGWNAKKTAKRTAYYNKGKKIKGLWKIGSDYYYFNSKGKLQKNKWKSLKGTYTKIKNAKKGTTKKVKAAGTFKFYFDKNGKAYRAGNQGTTQIKVKTIKSKKYGFDELGHMATGIRATMAGKAYFFDNKGVCDKEKTAELQKITKNNYRSAALMDEILTAFGQPKSIENTDACDYFDLPAGMELDDPNMPTYTGYILKYDQFEITMTKNEDNGIYCMQGAFPLDR